MTEILTELSPSSLATAVKSNLYAFFSTLRYSAKATVHDTSHGFGWRTGVSHPWFNGMLSTLPSTEYLSLIVEETVSYFQAHDITSFTWWLAPYLEATTWSPHLLAYGFQYDNNTPGMAIELAKLRHPQISPLTIRHVEDPRVLTEWTQTFIQGFEMAAEMAHGFLALLESLGTDFPFRHYLGYLDGKPVASSTLFLGAGVAGIYNVATVPAARGRGIGSEMTLAPLYEARDLGYRVGVLQSSDMGYGVYRRLGFQQVCQMDHFYWRAPNS